jgi:probable O-glycosylation ligase (exosortase A-associated)
MAQGRFAFRAILVFTFILLIAPQERFPSLQPLRPALLAGLCAIVGLLIDRFERREAWRTPIEFWLAGLLLAWALVTVPFSMWPGGSASLIKDLFVKSILVLWLLGRVVNTVDRAMRLAWTLTLFSLPIAASGIANYRAGAFVDQGSNRIVGYGSAMAGNPNDLALTLAIILPLTIAVFLSHRSRLVRIVAGGAALLNVATIVVTFSRGGFIALAVIAVLSTFWFIRRQAFGVVAVIAVVVVGAPAVLPGGYLERLQTIADMNSDPTHSAQERWRDMRAATQLIAERPLMGTGIGQDVLALNDARGATWRQVHDVYLEYGVDLGIPGLTLFVLLLGSSVWTAHSAERRARVAGDTRLAALSHGVVISLVTFAIAAVFYPVAYYYYFYYLAGLAVALGALSGSRKS